MADELTSDSAVLQDKLGHADHITPVPVSESPTPPEGPSPSSVSEGSTAGVGETLIGWDGPDDPANPKKWGLLHQLCQDLWLIICSKLATETQMGGNPYRVGVHFYFPCGFVNGCARSRSNSQRVRYH